jgi:hypothetical protein
MNIFKKVAPFLSTALGMAGPAGAIAGSILNKVAGVDAKSHDDIAAAIAAAPDQAKLIADIKAAEQEFQARMAELDVKKVEDLEKIAADDRASARNREINVRDNTPRILAYLYAAGFFLTLGAEIWIGVSGITVNPLTEKSIDILLGVLTGMVLGTKEYYFGSSAGSDKKNDIISKLSE